jgi:hypothetical protein
VVVEAVGALYAAEFCSDLDPSEPSHDKLKRLLFFLLKSRRDHVIPDFHSSYAELFEGLENELATKGKALYDTNPAETKLGLDGQSHVGKWVLFQLAPQLSLGLPVSLEELQTLTWAPASPSWSCREEKNEKKKERWFRGGQRALNHRSSSTYSSSFFSSKRRRSLE